MKTNKMIFWAIALLALVFLVFARPVGGGSVTGTFTPKGSASQVWLYSGNDTVRGIVQNDAFQVANVKTGTYTLAVEGVAPFKGTTRTGIKVNEGEPTNVGEIVMER